MIKLTNAALSCIAFLLLSGCQTASSSDGRVENGRYHDPHGLFSIQIPPVLRGSPTVRDQMTPAGGTVTFMDEHGRLVRVDRWTGSGPEWKAIIHSTDWKMPLDRARLFLDAVMRPVFPRVALVHQEYTAWGGKHANYYVYEIEDGSNVVDVQTRKRLDALRASISFIRGSSVFTVSMQHTFGIDGLNDEDRTVIAGRLKGTLEKIANTMRFAE